MEVVEMGSLVCVISNHIYPEGKLKVENARK